MGISPKDLAMLEQRLARARTAGEAPRGGPLPGPARREPDPAPAATRILGVDPSLRGTGWGVLRLDGRAPRTVACGTIRCPPEWPRTRCLHEIARVLTGVLQEHPVEVCAVEGLFHARNLQTALIMGEARGAALSAVAGSGIPVFEIAPRKVKLAVVGYGAAQKSAVARMVQRLTGMDEIPAADAADALAIAIAYSQEAGRSAFRTLKRV